jgi:hypothetical protein
VNADKPALDYLEIGSRVRQFAAGERLWLTRAPTFVEKSLLFPGATFVVGVDTIERIAQARFYEGPDGVERAMERFAAQGCRFLVFGRSRLGVFRTLADLELSPAVAGLCRAVPAEQFRVDLSSTELRRRGETATE